jgi:alpha-glucosidase (family GH31 glycosyl hydrolase)
MGAPVESTNEKQPLEELRVYPGADATFDLYNDDGTAYTYEKGAMEITYLQWSDAAQKLTHTGAALTGPPDASLVKVVHAQ